MATNTIAAAGPFRCHMTGIYSCAGLAAQRTGRTPFVPATSRSPAMPECRWA